LKVLKLQGTAEVDLDKSALLQEAARQDQNLILKTTNKTLDQNLNLSLVLLEAQKLETAPAAVKAKAKL
jgi:hypothetical protein